MQRNLNPQRGNISLSRWLSAVLLLLGSRKQDSGPSKNIEYLVYSCDVGSSAAVLRGTESQCSPGYSDHDYHIISSRAWAASSECASHTSFKCLPYCVYSRHSSSNRYSITTEVVDGDTLHYMPVQGESLSKLIKSFSDNVTAALWSMFIAALNYNLFVRRVAS
jgi:hypothetical protein